MSPSRTSVMTRGTDGSNPASSSGESRANLNFNGESQEVKTIGDELAPKVRRPQNGGQLDAGPSGGARAGSRRG
jgi:hypothetical protein